MLKRKIEQKLIDWKNTENRKPLIIKGCRQCGKTFSVLDFAKKNYKNVVYLNFFENPDYASVFAGSLEVDTIVMMLSALLGSEAGALYGAAGIMAYNILFFTYVQHLFDPEAKVSIKAFLTPTNITTAIMVVMLVTGLRLPAILDSFCKAVGNTTTPLALMIAGGMLARSDLKKLVTNPMVWLITALRCVVFPLGFLAALYFLPLDRTLCMAILILASCPAGSLTAVLAKQYDTEGELASQAVAHSTLSILISVPLVLSLGSTLLGI